MRRSGSWQGLWDDRLLEILSNEGPKAVKDLAESKYILVSDATVSRRLKKLADHGMVIALGNGVYQISEEGKAYLRGEYNAEEGVYINKEEETNGSSTSETYDSTNGAT